MTFGIATSEQIEICQSVRRLAQAEIQKYQNEPFFGTVPRGLLRAFATLGVTALNIEEQWGGLAASPTTIALALEEIAASDCGVAIWLSVHNMVSGLVQRFGNQEQRQRYLPKLASGDFLAAFCLTEPSAGSDAKALKTEARPEGANFILNGEKCYITSAGFADLYLVFARTTKGTDRKGISVFLVEADSPGLQISPPDKKMGAELSPIASLAFVDCVVPKTQLVGEIDNGYRIALGGLAGGRINIAAIANGVSRSAIELATAHLKERAQFGKKLIEFQGLQFMLADMQMKFEAARLLTLRAAHLLEKDPSDKQNRLQPSIAKCFASDAAMSITTDAVQLLGGAGYIKHYRVEQLMRDAKMLQIVEGTNQIQRMVIARELAE
ncbi:MAG: acyl-CoA dehydrogenase family protein [Oligoflexia bacterium]|nr:acyl-CoA dehydrogenase family protein [Oligoflexia bacterium]